MAPGLQPCSGSRPQFKTFHALSSACRRPATSWLQPHCVQQLASKEASHLAPKHKRALAAPAYLRWVPAAPGHGNRLSTVTNAHTAIPPAQGLFDPANDKDACGVGFVAELSKEDSRKCVTDALGMLLRMTHRGACGCEVNTGAAIKPHLSTTSNRACKFLACRTTTMIQAIRHLLLVPIFKLHTLIFSLDSSSSTLVVVSVLPKLVCRRWSWYPCLHS